MMQTVQNKPCKYDYLELISIMKTEGYIKANNRHVFSLVKYDFIHSKKRLYYYVTGKGNIKEYAYFSEAIEELFREVK